MHFFHLQIESRKGREDNDDNALCIFALIISIGLISAIVCMRERKKTSNDEAQDEAMDINFISELLLTQKNTQQKNVLLSQV